MSKRKLVLVSSGGVFGSGKKFSGRAKRTMILGAAAVIALILTLVLWTQSGYAVSVDGQVVGTVKNEDEFIEIVAHVEEDVSVILGYEYELDTEVELTGTIGSEEDHIAEAMMESVDEIAMLYTLEVDGVAVAVAETEGELRAAVEQISVTYSMGDDSTVSFDNKITVSYGYAPVSDILTTDEVVAILDPANGGEYALTVRTVTHETYQEIIAYTTEYVDNPDAYEGTETVETTGANGTADVTMQLEYVNGTLSATQQTAYVVVQEPVTEVISVGTMVRPAWASYGTYIWPCRGYITSYFGYRDVEIGSSFHKGLDIAYCLGEPIYAADGGVVTYSGEWDAYGLIVEITHDNGEVTRYAHCHSLNVRVGDKVAQGDVIALMGNTGTSSGVHLHFEIRVDGQPIDPLKRLP